MHEESVCKTVLIVEDEQIIGDLIGEILRDELHTRAYLALNGAQAMALIERLTPDLIILDYQLPDMHGLQLYDHFHARRNLAAVPTLVVSANPPVGEIAQRHLPYLQKPFELNELVSLAQQLLRMYDPLRRSGHPDRQRGQLAYGAHPCGPISIKPCQRP
ncbi:MAG TPA: response regulator [Ktedonobacteraceae bacterium]